MSKITNENDQEEALMSDEEFAEFMEAKFNNERQHENELEKKKTWNSISKNLNKTHDKNNWLSFASVAILILAILPTFFIPSEQDDFTRIKGSIQIINPTLEIFQLSKDGELLKIENKASIGDTLIFKASVDSEAIIALAQKKNQDDANIRFISEPLSPGLALILKRDNRTYGYSIENNDKNLKFCLLGASTNKALESKINQLRKSWSTLSKLACREIHIK